MLLAAEVQVTNELCTKFIPLLKQKGKKKPNLQQERPAPWTETKREDEGRKELCLKVGITMFFPENKTEA